MPPPGFRWPIFSVFFLWMAFFVVLSVWLLVRDLS